VNDRELQKYRKAKNKAKAKLRRLANDPDLNPNSPQQLVKLLYGRLGLKILKYTEKGNPSTTKAALMAYKNVPAVRALFAFRANRKGVSDLESFEQRAVADDIADGYCLHGRFRQAGIRTGRLSCAAPNFQGLADATSSRSAVVISSRAPLGPRPGYVWLTADYSQIEARIFVARSDEPVMRAALESGADLHSRIANAIWGGRGNPRAIEAAMESLGTTSRGKARAALEAVDYDIVKLDERLGKKLWRSRGKSLVFARIMGGGIEPIMNLVGCDAEVAQQLLEDIDCGLPGVRQFSKQCQRAAYKAGYTTTMYGRRLQHRFDLDEGTKDDCYKGSAYLIQGTAADLIKRRMVACDRYFRRHELDAHIVLTIHDELIFEIHQSQFTGRLVRAIKGLMKDDGGAIGIDLPVEMNVIRRNWAKKKKLDVDRLREGQIVFVKWPAK
jgi:DNA polymerase-1